MTLGPTGCLYGISIVQLLANPEKYDRKRVRIIGYVHFDSGASGIYQHDEDQEQHSTQERFLGPVGRGRCRRTAVRTRMHCWEGRTAPAATGRGAVRSRRSPGV
jgi:hypothetical protein